MRFSFVRLVLILFPWCRLSGIVLRYLAQPEVDEEAPAAPAAAASASAAAAAAGGADADQLYDAPVPLGRRCRRLLRGCSCCCDCCKDKPAAGSAAAAAAAGKSVIKWHRENLLALVVLGLELAQLCAIAFGTEGVWNDPDNKSEWSERMRQVVEWSLVKLDVSSSWCGEFLVLLLAF